MFLVFVLVMLMVLFQYQLYRKSLRADQAFGGLVESLEKWSSGGTEDGSVPAAGGESFEYPGDEGDWRIWAFRVEPRTLNPISADSDIYARWICNRWIFEPLLVYDYETVEMEPLLAESFEVSEDGLHYWFTIREDARFSDGHPVTADDVIFTYKTIVDPGVDAANMANYYLDVEKVEKIGERGVHFVMKRPFFKALENLSFWDFGVLPEHIYRYEDPMDFNNRVSDPVGSGPYVFENWTKGDRVVLRRNEKYWGPKPKIEKLVYKFVVNEQASLEALKAGQVDMIIPTPEQYGLLEEDQQMHEDFLFMEYWNPGAPFYYIGWNQDVVFFEHARVRRAMTHLIDRQEIVDVILRGHASMISGPFFLKGKQNDPTIAPLKYDPILAGKLLDEAGWTDSDGDGIRDKDGQDFKFKFAYSGSNQFYRQLATLLKDWMAQAGVRLEPEPIEWSVLLVRIKERKFESMVMGWGGDILEDPYQLWHSSQIGGGGSNYVGFANSEADEIIETARAEMNELTRNRMYHRLHRILHDEQPYTFLFARPTFRIVDNRFENTNVYTLGPDYMEWYVPKAKQKY